MQLIHLLLADLLWISLVLMTAAALAEGVPHVELSAVGNHPELPPGLIHASRTLTRVPTKWVDGLQSASGAAQQDSGPEIRTPAGPQGASLNPSPRAAATWKDYLALTKPRVISLLLFTTLTAMWIAAAGRSGPGPGFWLYVAVGLGFYMAAGAANAINMVLERDLDLRMGRTARRPTVTQAVPPRAALQFAFALTVGSFALLWGAANLLSAMLALAGLAFYVVIYTLLLKRRTWSNIVIGGAAGAFPPLVGWAAVTGDLSPLAWCLFGIIFLWTPVHFWALAILLKEDYARAGVPMLPVARGEEATRRQILIYSALLVATSLLPVVVVGGLGGLYLAGALACGLTLVVFAARLARERTLAAARTLFWLSNNYLALLFALMVLDRVLR
jgi:protoheme IX farnesyltransferase